MIKKTLLAGLLVAGSVFFASAQFGTDGGLRLNIGKVCGTFQGKPACVNPLTGQWEFSTGNGNSIGGNVNTGQIGGSGSVNGVRVSGSATGLLGGTTGSANTSGVPGTSVANNPNFGGVLGLLNLAQTIVARMVPLLIGVALLAFFWFLIEFIWKGKDSPDKQKEGKMGMAYSLLAIFVMVSVWGIITFMGQIVGIKPGGTMPGYKNPGEQ
jgi:hypothetical protein